MEASFRAKICTDSREWERVDEEGFQTHRTVLKMRADKSNIESDDGRG